FSSLAAANTPLPSFPTRRSSDLKHPYTRALLKSIPSVSVAPRTLLPTIAGSIPHPLGRPRGCPFHPRCPDAIPGLCAERVPSLRDRKSTRLNSSHQIISYAVFCL